MPKTVPIEECSIRLNFRQATMRKLVDLWHHEYALKTNADGTPVYFCQEDFLMALLEEEIEELHRDLKNDQRRLARYYSQSYVQNKIANGIVSFGDAIKNFTAPTAVQS
jgi:hypothetical protein